MKPIIKLVALTLVLGASWVVVQAQQARDAAVPRRARRAGNPLPVRTSTVREKEQTIAIGAACVTVPSETASIWIGAGQGLRDIGVKVTAVHVVEGQRVRKGQLLFELESDLFGQAVKRQEAALAAAQSELASIHQLRKERAATGVQLRNAELNRELAYLDLRIAERDLERCQIRSPIDGFADVVLTVLGEEVDAGREVTRIHKLDPIHLRLDFPQERLEDVFAGQDAEVVLDSFPQEKLSAKVVRIAPQADPETRVLPVVLEMGNASLRIRAGLTGYARLHIQRKAMIAPTTSIMRRGSQAMVFRMEQGRANIRNVQTGDHLDIGEVEVLSGLQIGDEVVVHGNEFLRDGDLARDDWQTWARRE